MIKSNPALIQGGEILVGHVAMHLPCAEREAYEAGSVFPLHIHY